MEESVRDYGKYLKLRSMMMIGGVNIKPQISRLKSRVDILVATPGRLLDHVQQKTLSLSRIEILVLDEADRMLDMGFIRDIKKILALLPKKRQNLLFSATFSDEIQLLADNLLNNPELIEVARRNAIAEKVTHVVHPVDRHRKRDLLAHLIKQHRWSQVLVFTRTKHGANKLAEFLIANDISSLAIHGNKSQSARTRALAEFKTGSLQVLVATDIAARGIDIIELPHVVNFELPNVAEDYVHRIGRTGRAGNEGEAMSLVCVDELKLLKDIERLTKSEIPKIALEGYDVDPSIKAEPIQNGRGGRQQQPRRRSGGNNSGGRNASAKSTSSKGKSSRKPNGKQTTDRSSGNKSESPWATANKNRSRSRNSNQNQTPSGNR